MYTWIHIHTHTHTLFLLTHPHTSTHLTLKFFFFTACLHLKTFVLPPSSSSSSSPSSPSSLPTCPAPSFPVVFGGGDRGEMGDEEGGKGGGEEGLRDLEVRGKEGESNVTSTQIHVGTFPSFCQHLCHYHYQ